MPAALPRLRVRRSRHLVVYWRDGRLLVHNYVTGRRIVGDPLLCRILDYCGDWKTPADIARAIGLADPALTARVLSRLLSRSLLERDDRSPDSRTQAMKALDRWNPEVGFFHTATKDVRFWSPLEAMRQARLRPSDAPMPSPVKRYRGAALVDLARPKAGAFADLLRARRTWRRFSSAPLDFEDLSTVLGLSSGIQQWVRTGPYDLPLKTSPSGGARHPIECYVVARDVRGLRPGVYHYAPGRHGLERIRGPIAPKRLGDYYPGSRYFAKAPAQVFFTALFSRQLWRYPYSRAYRAALVEAGHVCQTFCLTATWLGLAPYCLMGLADSLIEEDLRLDGISESILYAAGLGHPPRGTRWAPLAAGTKGTLKARPNPHLR